MFSLTTRPATSIGLIEIDWVGIRYPLTSRATVSSAASPFAADPVPGEAATSGAGWSDFAGAPRYHLIPKPAQPTARKAHRSHGSQAVPPAFLGTSSLPASRSSLTRSVRVGAPLAATPSEWSVIASRPSPTGR